ncbi:MAG: ATP-binding cassette domain-containing protein [Rubrivivax sp.]
MPGSISLKALSYTTPDGVPLLSSLDLSFGPVRTGLIGRNGVGKSTLLRLITGDIPAAAGSVSIAGSIGLLRQVVQREDLLVIDALGQRDAMERIDRVVAGNGSIEDVAEADWALPGQIETALSDVGLAGLDLDRAIGSLSGGQRTRLAIAAMLVRQPDMLLLDEPTNNLDADGRALVGKVLREWRGGAIVVSHDRALLEEMDQIVELTSIGANVFGGNWSFYEARKAAELAAAEHTLAHAERTLDELDRKTQLMRERKARRDGAGARKAARGDIPRIMLGGMKNNSENTSGEQARLGERRRAAATGAVMDAKAEIEILQPMAVQLEPSGLARGTTVLQVDRLTGGPVAGQPVIRALSLALVGPERVAITGANGTGKTTLLRLITGELQPESGAVRITPSPCPARPERRAAATRADDPRELPAAQSRRQRERGAGRPRPLHVPGRCGAEAGRPAERRRDAARRLGLHHRQRAAAGAAHSRRADQPPRHPRHRRDRGRTACL